MKLIKNYDCTIDYHLEKANVVVDALSRKNFSTLEHTKEIYSPLLGILRALTVNLAVDDNAVLLAQLLMELLLLDHICET